MISIHIKKHIRTYNGANIIEVNADFANRQISQIIGPSGAGKTTLLKIIAGLADAHEGRIVVNDKTWLDTLAGINLMPQQRNVGFVFQDYALFPNMTVSQHLRYGTNDAQYIDRLIGLGRLEGFHSHKPGQLSGGQQQRLSILRALSTKPNLLLMDEPFSALDRALKIELITDLRTLFDELGITCLIVTHENLAEFGFADATFDMAEL